MVYHKLSSSKGQIEDTPHANICSIYLTAKCLPLPFSSIDEISCSLGKRERDSNLRPCMTKLQ